MQKYNSLFPLALLSLGGRRRGFFNNTLVVVHHGARPARVAAVVGFLGTAG